MKKANEKRDSSIIQKIVDDQSRPGPPFLEITKNEGQGPLSPHHVKASTPRGEKTLGNVTQLVKDAKVYWV